MGAESGLVLPGMAGGGEAEYSGLLAALVRPLACVGSALMGV